ncbi:hypothetical protein Vafri_14930 [Volvox africanus]|uniref:Uncharacterized protein n=1 Tax=Volvox africanus TaxID=51714 RepID=A0A8J4BEC6_9CHLO|nr:hypothetical protein Vafri_14930 [Volvox africanus]
MQLNSVPEQQSIELSDLRVRPHDDVPSGVRTYARGLSSRGLTPLRSPRTLETPGDSTPKVSSPPFCSAVPAQLPGLVPSPGVFSTGKAAAHQQDCANHETTPESKLALAPASGEPAALDIQSSDVVGSCGPQHNLSACTMEQCPGDPFILTVEEPETALKGEVGPWKLLTPSGMAAATAATATTSAPPVSPTNRYSLRDGKKIKRLDIAILESTVRTDSLGAGAGTSSSEPSGGQLHNCGAGTTGASFVYTSRFSSAQPYNSGDGSSSSSTNSSRNVVCDGITARCDVSESSIPGASPSAASPCPKKARSLGLRGLGLGQGKGRLKEEEVAAEGDFIASYCAALHKSLMEEQERCRRVAQLAGRRLERQQKEARERAAAQMQEKNAG